MKFLKFSVTAFAMAGILCGSVSAFAFQPEHLSKNELKHAPPGCQYVLAVPADQSGEQPYYGPEAGADQIGCSFWLANFRRSDPTSQEWVKKTEHMKLNKGIDFWRREAGR